MDVENQKNINADLQAYLNDLLKEQNKIQQQIQKYAEEMKKCSLTIDKKQTFIDAVTKRIDTANAKKAVSTN